jgi:hypothetical protein
MSSFFDGCRTSSRITSTFLTTNMCSGCRRIPKARLSNSHKSCKSQKPPSQQDRKCKVNLFPRSTNDYEWVQIKNEVEIPTTSVERVRRFLEKRFYSKVSETGRVPVTLTAFNTNLTLSVSIKLWFGERGTQQSRQSRTVTQVIWSGRTVVGIRSCSAQVILNYNTGGYCMQPQPTLQQRLNNMEGLRENELRKLLTDFKEDAIPRWRRYLLLGYNVAGVCWSHVLHDELQKVQPTLYAKEFQPLALPYRRNSYGSSSTLSGICRCLSVLYSVSGSLLFRAFSTP